MASLLSIPEELLDTIIELVLLDERDPPTDLDATRQRRATNKRTRGDGVLSWDYGPRNALFETTAVVPAATSLLLVNRQAHRQTKQAISRLFPNGVNYKLDAMFVDEAQLWPTWFSVPAPSKEVNNVDVTVRIFGRRDPNKRSAFVIGDGSPPQFVWLFYWLLEHFLRHGTSTSSNSPHNRDSNISVKTINLNFLSGEPDLKPEDTEEEYANWRSRHTSFLDADDDEISEPAEPQPARMHPAWLARKVEGYLAGLPGMSYHTAAYGALLHERVGSITVSSEGEEIGQVRMGEILASRGQKPEPGSDWYTQATMGHVGLDCRLLTFWNWKYATVQRRKAVGLEVGMEIVWPTLEEWRRWKRAREEYRSRTNDGCDVGRCLCDDRGLEEMLEKGGGMC